MIRKHITDLSPPKEASKSKSPEEKTHEDVEKSPGHKSAKKQSWKETTNKALKDMVKTQMMKNVVAKLAIGEDKQGAELISMFKKQSAKNVDLGHLDLQKQS